MKKHIAVDMDDVVLDFVVGVCATVSRDFGVTVQPEDIRSWNFGQYLDPIIGYDWWEWMENHARLWAEKFKPVPGAIGSLERLRAEGYYLELVTSKPPWAEAAVYEWLGRYLRHPTFQRITIVPVGNKALQKHTITDAPILVDDRYENARDWAKSRDDRLAILYDRPHNADFEKLPPRVERAFNWRHVSDLIEEATRG